MNRIHQSRRIVSGLVGILGLASAAQANALLHQDIFDNSTWSQVLYHDSTLFINQNNVTQQNMGLGFNNSVTASLSHAGWVGSGTTLHNANYTPANPGINGTFDKHTAVCINFVTVTGTAAQWSEYAGAANYGLITFSVSQPTAWTISGTAVGQTNAASSGWSEAQNMIRLYNWNTSSYLVNSFDYALNGVGDYNYNFSYGGTLAPGLYTYDYRSWAQHGGWDNSPTVFGSSSASLLITLNLTKVPAPGAASLLAAMGVLAARRRR